MEVEVHLENSLLEPVEDCRVLVRLEQENTGKKSLPFWLNLHGRIIERFPTRIFISVCKRNEFYFKKVSEEAGPVYLVELHYINFHLCQFDKITCSFIHLFPHAIHQRVREINSCLNSLNLLVWWSAFKFADQRGPKLGRERERRYEIR